MTPRSPLRSWLDGERLSGVSLGCQLWVWTGSSEAGQSVGCQRVSLEVAGFRETEPH